MGKSPDAFRTISEVAEWLDTQAHVLRFWESKFTQVKPVKRAGGRRYYRPVDMLLLGGIKKLLHQDGLTIKAVQKLLREEGNKYIAAMSPPLDDVLQAEIEEGTATVVDTAGFNTLGDDVHETPLYEDMPSPVMNAHVLQIADTPASLDITDNGIAAPNTPQPAADPEMPIFHHTSSAPTSEAEISASIPEAPLQEHSSQDDQQQTEAPDQPGLLSEVVAIRKIAPENRMEVRTLLQRLDKWAQNAAG